MDIEFEYQDDLAGCSCIFMDGREIAMIPDFCFIDMADEDKQRVKQAVRILIAAPDLYRDLLYLVSVLRSMPIDLLKQVEEREELSERRPVIRRVKHPVKLGR